MSDLTQAQMDQVATLIKDVADRIILPGFGTATVSEKSSSIDLVTEADTAAENALTEGLAAIFPDAAIVGEEAYAEDDTILDNLSEQDLTAIIDPIDGTWNYAHGIAVFGCIVALVARGRTVGGVIYDPISQEILLARKGQGAALQTADGQSTRLMQAETAEGAPFHLLMAQEYLAAPALPRVEPHFARKTFLGCSAHDYRLLAKGAYSGAICHGLKPWDHAAGALIYQETGGVSELVALDATQPGVTYAPTCQGGMMIHGKTPAHLARIRPHAAALRLD